MSENVVIENISNLMIYQTEDGKSRIDVQLQDNTVWLTQAMLATLYQTTPQNVTMRVFQYEMSLNEAPCFQHEMSLETQITGHF